MNNGQQGPIFIGGPERSGKTYMRMMLTAHPRIALSRRTHMWTLFYGRFGNLNQPDNFERCLRAMLRRKLIRALEPDVGRIRREFWQGRRTYGRLFALFHEQFAERTGKARWGGQTGLIERCAAPIFAAYPDARIIQMIRDPRDRFAALCDRDPRNHGKLGQATAKWRYSVTCARRNQRAFPTQYLVVSYELMVSQPEATLRKVCRFLGETFSPAMLSLADEPRFAPFGLRKSPLSSAYVGRYRSRLSRDEIAFVEALAGAYMRTYAYAPAPVRLTAWEKARFYLGTWGPHVAQMIGWRAWHAARIHFAQRAGDKPHAARPVAGSVLGQLPG